MSPGNGARDAVSTNKMAVRRSRSHSTSPSSRKQLQDAGHVEWAQGQTITPRYQVKRLLGDGTFGRVLEAEDLHDHSLKALKVIRAVKRYVVSAKIEADIIRRLNAADPESQSHIVRMTDSFVWESSFVLVFEPLGPSLYDVIKQNEYKGRTYAGFSMHEVQLFAKQILQAADFMHRMHLTHTDLKPENILLQTDCLVTDPATVMNCVRNDSAPPALISS